MVPLRVDRLHEGRPLGGGLPGLGLLRTGLVHRRLDFLQLSSHILLRCGLIQHGLALAHLLRIWSHMLAGPCLRRRVLSQLAMQHRCLVQLLRAGHLQPVVGLPVHELLRSSLPLITALSCLEAFQAGVVHLDLFEDVALGASGGLRFCCWMCRCTMILSGTPPCLGFLLLLG